MAVRWGRAPTPVKLRDPTSPHIIPARRLCCYLGLISCGSPPVASQLSFRKVCVATRAAPRASGMWVRTWLRPRLPFGTRPCPKRHQRQRTSASAPHASRSCGRRNADRLAKNTSGEDPACTRDPTSLHVPEATHAMGQEPTKDEDHMVLHAQVARHQESCIERPCGLRVATRPGLLAGPGRQRWTPDRA